MRSLRSSRPTMIISEEGNTSNNPLISTHMENQIFQDLKGLHLSGMAECWQNLQETRKHQEIVLQDGLAMLIQAEHDQRAANKTARLIKNARFRYDASIEQVLFDPAKGRDQGRIMQLASCEYIKQGASVLITGPAGVGKSYLSTSRYDQARHFRYIVPRRTSDLLL